MPSLILYLLFFSLPFQTRILFSPGVNEYQSIFLYATDILIGFLFLFWSVQLWKSNFHSSNHSLKFRGKNFLIPLGSLIGWFAIASVLSENISLGLYRTIKLGEGLWLFFYLLSLPRIVYRNALNVLIGSAVFQSILAIGQFLTQHDWGLRILGENALSPDIAGVAKLEIFGEKIIRAYGTFPHPNVLATFLLLCLFLISVLYKKESKQPFPHHSPFIIHYSAFAALRLRRKALFIIPFFVLALLLTFSRTVIILGALALAAWFFFTYKQRLFKPLLIIIGSFIIFGIVLLPYLQSRLQLSLKNQEISLRVWYTKNAFDAIRASPILGVGPGQFTSFQEPITRNQHLPPWANQPVHNIYLLLASEAGIPALFFFFWFLFRIFHPLFSKNNFPFIIHYSAFAALRLRRKALFIIPILAIGLFDHFFFTFQQGTLIFWTALAFLINMSRIKV